MKLRINKSFVIYIFSEKKTALCKLHVNINKLQVDLNESHVCSDLFKNDLQPTYNAIVYIWNTIDYFKNFEFLSE